VLVKIVSLFLIGIAALAMLGRLRWPGGQPPRIGKRPDKPPKPVRCKACGAYKVGPGPCPCGKG
jgi:hypothetical protein